MVDDDDDDDDDDVKIFQNSYIHDRYLKMGSGFANKHSM